MMNIWSNNIPEKLRKPRIKILFQGDYVKFKSYGYITDTKSLPCYMYLLRSGLYEDLDNQYCHDYYNKVSKYSSNHGNQNQTKSL